MFRGNKQQKLAIASLVLMAVSGLALSGCSNGGGASPTASASPAPGAAGNADQKPTLRATPGTPDMPSPTNIQLPDDTGIPNPVEGNTPFLIHFKEGSEAATIIAEGQSEKDLLSKLPAAVRSSVEGAVAQSYCRIESSKAIGANLRLQLNCMLNEAKVKELAGHLENISEVEWAEKEQRGEHA